MDYRGARFYDSEVGRFLSLDPLAAEFSDWSDYNYVLGNPEIYIDKDGKAPVECCQGIKKGFNDWVDGKREKINEYRNDPIGTLSKDIQQSFSLEAINTKVKDITTAGLYSTGKNLHQIATADDPAAEATKKGLDLALKGALSYVGLKISNKVSIRSSASGVISKAGFNPNKMLGKLYGKTATQAQKILGNKWNVSSHKKGGGWVTKPDGIANQKTKNLEQINYFPKGNIIHPSKHIKYTDQNNKRFKKVSENYNKKPEQDDGNTTFVN